MATLGLSTEVQALRDALPAAYRAHDHTIAAGGGHEKAWHDLMGVLVATGSGGADRRRVVEALWRAQPTQNLWRDVPDEARALLASLTRAGVPMVITSNSEGRAAALLSELGIAEHFVDILDSGVLGFSKPDRRMFDLAAARAGVPLSGLAHVGDSERADIVGAKEAGAWAVRFDGFVPGSTEGSTVAHARAPTFAALRSILSHALARPL